MIDKKNIPQVLQITLDKSNKTLYWFSTDTQELFEKNKVNNQDIFDKFGYTEKSITYKFNNFGFRSPEFDEDCNSIVTLGCSFTVGVGVKFEDTWPYLLSKLLKLKLFNLAQPGASPLQVFHLAKFYLKYLNPKYVFILMPHMFRFGYANASAIQTLQLFHEYKKSKYDKLDYEILNSEKLLPCLLKEFNNTYDLYETLYIDAIQKNTSAPVYNCSLNDSPILRDMLARDLSHPSVKTHEKLAKNFYMNIL
jgi:hypothetical protein